MIDYALIISTPIMTLIFPDNERVYGAESNPSMHLLPLGSSEGKQAGRGATTDQTARNEPHECTPGYFLRNLVDKLISC